MSERGFTALQANHFNELTAIIITPFWMISLRNAYSLPAIIAYQHATTITHRSPPIQYINSSSSEWAGPFIRCPFLDVKQRRSLRGLIGYCSRSRDMSLLHEFLEVPKTVGTTEIKLYHGCGIKKKSPSVG